jgi:ribosomal-protein-alanine N-acetyltransferase
MTRLESDPEVMKFTPARVPQTSEATKVRLKSLVEKQAAYSPLGVWAVELKETSEFVGWFMLVKAEFEIPEIGFMMVRNYWGKGLATEVAQALIDFGMRDLGYPGIAGVTDHDNTASIHILKKLGFQKVRSRKMADKILGREIEGHIFELRRS